MADSKEKEKQAREAHAHAEKCFLAGNVLAAKMWMQSAVRLAPHLPGTPQIIAAYDVHVAAAWSTRDWYDVLGLKPAGRASALTHDDIRKQHRRLCLLVHPDKNPSAAADGAFKLIQAAWHALSANHAPLGTAVPAPPPPQRPAAAPPRPPEPQPRPPEPQPRPPPRRPAPTYYYYPEPPTYDYPEPPKPKQKRKCPAFGGLTINGRNNAPTLIGRNNYRRCMSCLWSPKDGKREPHEDDCDVYFFD